MPKVNQVEPTEMQKKAAENVLQQKLAGGNINKGKALLAAGYSISTSKAPALITKSKGYRQYLDKHGLNEDRVAGLIAEDIANLPAGDRFPYIKLMAQMFGMLEAKVDLNITRSDEGLEMISRILADAEDRNIDNNTAE